MTYRFPRIVLLSVLTAALSSPFFIPSASAKESAAASFNGASYEASNKNTQDFRGISTLSGFDLLVARDRWQGINASDLLAEFKKFDGVQGSPALREIWHNVLLGDFSGLKTRNGEEQAQLMAERLRILNRLGYFDDAARLYMQAAQKKPIPEAIAVQGVEALALSGSADGACLEVVMAAPYLKNDTWTQNAAMCQAYFGDKAKAEEFYSQVKDSDEGFRTVLKVLESNGGSTIQIGIPPLWRTLMLAKGASVSESALDKADAMTLAALAQHPKVPFGIRLAAASRAADRGTIGIDKLRKLYEEKNPTPESVAGYVDAAQNGADLPAADIYGAARFTFEGNARAAIVRTAMRNLHPVTNIKGQVYGWIVDKLTLQVEKLGWFAPYGFALMTETNRRASADMYYEVGKLENSSLSVVYAILEQKPWTKDNQKEWQNAMEETGKKDKVGKAFNVAKAFDQEDKLALNQNAIIKTDESKPSGILQDSIRKGGRGLTLVAALNRLATVKQMSQLSTSEVSEIIADLGKQGQFGERKKIALEILLQIVL